MHGNLRVKRGDGETENRGKVRNDKIKRVLVVYVWCICGYLLLVIID